MFCFLLISGFPVLDLIPDTQVGPDDEEVYEAVEDSLMVSANADLLPPMRHYLVWRLDNESMSSTPLAADKWRSFIRANLRQSRRTAWVILEKDRGEGNWADFWGGGFSFWWGNHRFTFGDYLFHFGRGLIFSSPYYRSRIVFRELSNDSNHFPRSAQEGRNLRGLRLDFNFGRYSVGMLGSYSMRDASLNSDGTVARLKFSGLHCDSVAILEKHQVGQLLAGSSFQWRVAPLFVSGLAFQCVRFTHRFAPADTWNSFNGQSLTAMSIYLGTKNSGRSAEMEITRSFPGSFAVSGGVTVNQVGINAAIAGTVYNERFFSPAGKSYALSRREKRTELAGWLDYKIRNFFIRFNGNTRYDYLTDSIPGRLQLGTGYRIKSFQMMVLIGKSFRGELAYSRFSLVELGGNWRRFQARIYLSDEYLENTPGRGRMAGISFKFTGQKVDFFASAALVDISGSNLVLSVPEPGIMRLGASYRCRETTQRLSFVWGWWMIKNIRLGTKFGFTHQQGWTPDFALQVETRG